eukprot:6361181-Amphidinium_carterae.1
MTWIAQLQFVTFAEVAAAVQLTSEHIVIGHNAVVASDVCGRLLQSDAPSETSPLSVIAGASSPDLHAHAQMTTPNNKGRARVSTTAVKHLLQRLCRQQHGESMACIVAQLPPY